MSSPYGGFRWNAISNSIAGKIALDSITDLSTIVTPLQPFQFDLRPVGGGSTISMTASLASDGSYLLTDMPLDIYNVAIKGSKWLRVVVPKISIATSVPVAGTAVGVDASLLGGDADGNNVVGLDDLGILALAFDTKPGDDLWDESADFNCDGVVGLDDLGLLANNFDIAGDP